MKWFIVSVLCYLLTFFNIETVEVLVSNIHICNSTNHTLKGAYEIKNITGGFMAKGSVFMTEDFGNDNKFSCQIFKYEKNKRRQLIDLTSEGACDALNQYGGIYWKVVERFGGVQKPGLCPVPKKTYNVGWARINFKAIPAMQMVPNGKFHIKCTLLDLSGKLIKACGSLDASIKD